jgi:PPOX class probable F420-dependent enzyme
MSPIPEAIRALFDAPNFVHLSTLGRDGAPRNWIVWVGLEGDQILVCTSDSQAKATDMRRDPRVGLSVADSDNPYRMAWCRGASSKYGRITTAATWTRSPSSTRALRSRAAARTASALSSRSSTPGSERLRSHTHRAKNL